MLHEVLESIETSRDRVIELHRRLAEIPALGPDNQGQGEEAKAELIRLLLNEIGAEIVREMPAPDDRVSSGNRPNIAARIPGTNTKRTLWLFGHMDIVPPGDLSLWSSDPYALKVDGDTITARGVEDNHQAIVCGLLLAETLHKMGAVPPLNLGLVFVSDEETGSKFGLEHVVENHSDLFDADDFFVVPDFGGPDSTLIEVAEKSMCWLKATVEGKQCHASTPQAGVNSLVAAADLILRIRSLYKDFPAQDPLFDPSSSTFEPTKKEANVENVNTIPGRDVFFVDCRVLPQYSLDTVLERVREMANEVSAVHGVRVSIDVVQREQAAPATPADSDVVKRLRKAIASVYGVKGRAVGIGGGTVAAFLRRKGFPAAVWSTLRHNAHQPDEHGSVRFNINDAKVFASMLWS